MRGKHGRVAETSPVAEPTPRKGLRNKGADPVPLMKETRRLIRLSLLTMAMVGLVSCRTDLSSRVPEAATLVKQIRVPGPVYNLKTDCGACGDGIRNDTTAFQKASELIRQSRGGRLFIPKGVYIVGKQEHKTGAYPYYQCQPIFSVTGCDGLVIEGEPGVVIRLDAQLRFGSFDKDKGTPFDPVAEKALKNNVFVDGRYAAGVGNMFTILKSRNIIIRQLELDGSNTNIVLGGMWGDKGRQLMGHGLYLYGNANVLVEDVNVHHLATDGIIIGYQGLKEGDPPAPHVLVNVRSEYNARQGLSWVGGNSLTAVRCAFNHTGRAGFSSSPAAGLDIEAELSICRNGLFRDCEFLDNHGLGMGADSGDGGYTRFEHCTFWGTKNWAIWPRKPGLSFTDCRFYGSLVHAYGSKEKPELATRYTRCTFEDKALGEQGVFRGTTLITIDGAGDNITFDSCEIIAHQVRAFWLTPGKDASYTLRDCRITHGYEALRSGDFQSLFRKGVVMENVRFSESFPDGSNKTYIISADNVAGDNVVVDGPRVRWAQWRHPATGVVWAASSKPRRGERMVPP